MGETTGVERLRELGREQEERSWSTVGKVRGRLMLDIADQIEREQGEDCYRMGLDHGAVWRVVTDMERHVLGHEGMEDSPVARWARELRGALGGRADVEVEDVATVRTDAMEAWRWVHEHGGIEVLRRLFQDADSRRVELCAALGIDLDNGWSEAMAAMRLRLMPEGYEWPRYEGGPLLRYGDSYIGDDGNNHRAWQIRFDSNADVHVSRSEDGDGFDRTTWDHFNKGERVRRPAVLASDGNRIEPAMDVWWICEGDERGIHAEMLHVDGIDDDGMVECSPYNGGTSVVLDPAELYVKKPVLDADGVPIKKGDTVYLLPGKWCDEFPCLGFHGGEELEVFADGEAHHVPGSVQCREREKRLGLRGTCYPKPSQLTHTKPEPPDSWERIEDDARGLDSGVDIDLFSHTHEDLVRRCKALAERGE